MSVNKTTILKLSGTWRVFPLCTASERKKEKKHAKVENLTLGKSGKSQRLYRTLIFSLSFLSNPVLCPAQKKNKNEEYLHVSCTKAGFGRTSVSFETKVCLCSSLALAHESRHLLEKVFQGNTLNQHPGINLPDPIQGWLWVAEMWAAYQWTPPRLHYLSRLSDWCTINKQKSLNTLIGQHWGALWFYLFYSI